MWGWELMYECRAINRRLFRDRDDGASPTSYYAENNNKNRLITAKGNRSILIPLSIFYKWIFYPLELTFM